MSAALLLGVSGCSGSAKVTSWTGLTVVGDKLYAADTEQARMLNLADGKSEWAFPRDPEEDRQGVFSATPAVDEEHVIVASQVPAAGFLGQPQNIIWGLDPETGSDLWRFDGASAQYVEGGALNGYTFVIGNSDGNVYALDTDSGALKWTFETGHRVWATPLIISDTVYIGSMDHHLYALNLSDGTQRWDFQAGGAFAGTPALQDGTLYLGAFDDTLYAVDARTGAESWSFAGENWFWGGPAVHDGVVYAADVSGNVYAVSVEGQQIWLTQLDAPVRAGPKLNQDGSQLFVGSKDGYWHALDTSDGFKLWSVENEGQMLSTPVVKESVVYGTLIHSPHRILALHMENGREVWAYPHVVEEK